MINHYTFKDQSDYRSKTNILKKYIVFNFNDILITFHFVFMFSMNAPQICFYKKVVLSPSHIIRRKKEHFFFFDKKNTLIKKTKT